MTQSVDLTFLQLVQGQLASHQLPSAIDIWDLENVLDDLRRRSLKVPPAQQIEWGACLVLQEDRLHLVHQISGWKEGVTPHCAPQEHEHYVGYVHTHLPDQETGRPYLGFSELDFRATLADGDTISLVCNGPAVFALVRTADRTQPCQVIDDQEFQC